MGIEYISLGSQYLWNNISVEKDQFLAIYLCMWNVNLDTNSYLK